MDPSTLHKYRALKECPQGQEPGEVFEATQDAGDVLVSVGAAEAVTPDTPLGKATSKRQPYKRRDLRAEE
jgi:hypothetical protein